MSGQPIFYGVFDRETGKRVAIQGFPNVASAERAIADWKNRCLKGGRPDISWELLQRLEVRQLIYTRNKEITADGKY